MRTVRDFFEQNEKRLGLRLITGDNTRRRITLGAQQPTLALTGYLKGFVKKRALVFGKGDISYLNELSGKMRANRLAQLISSTTPTVVATVSKNALPEELVHLCEKHKVSLFCAVASTEHVLSLLNEESLTTHATLVEVHGVGVLLKGDASLGKSEAALGLVKRGHKLVADDAVHIRKHNHAELEGSAPAGHQMEIRGIGIINVAHLHGATSVREKCPIDVVVKLELTDAHYFHDKKWLDLQHCKILGVNLPSYTVSVKEGRDVVMLLETIALNYVNAKLLARNYEAITYSASKE